MTENNPAFDNLIAEAVKFLNAGQVGEGADISGQAIKMAPERCEGYFTLAIAAYLLDDLGRALDMSQRGHDITPDCREGCDILAHLHAHAGNINDSVYFAKIAAVGTSYDLLSQIDIVGLDDLANAIDSADKTEYMTEAYRCFSAERFDDAVNACEKELRLHRNNTAAFALLGKALLGAGNTGQGLAALHAAVHMAPNDVSVQLLLGAAYYRVGQPELAMACHGAVLDSASLDADSLSQISHYYAGYSTNPWPDLDKAVASWRSRGQRPETGKRAVKKSKGGSDLVNVGMLVDRACLSDELGYLEPLLINLDRNNLSLTIYSRDVPEDPVAKRLKGLCKSWVNIREMSDDVACGIIRNADIGVLIDATVTADGHRPGIFAARPAGITVNWLAPRSGVFAGLYDHVMDEVAESPGGIALDGNRLAEIKGRSPVNTRGYITFASSCDFTVITPSVARVWSDILRSVPDSRLVLGDVNVIPDEVKQRAHELFTAFGASGRIEFAELNMDAKITRITRQLEFLVGADVYLDPFPMTGRTSVARALWCGLPVITLYNDTVQGQGAGIVRAAGMDRWLAHDAKNYVETAISASNTVTENDAWRLQAHKQVRSSLLCDPKQWAGKLCEALVGLTKT